MLALIALIACDPAPEDIAKAVTSENPVMREDGAKIAQNYDDPAVVEALVSVLADPSEVVRLNAIESLAELEATSASQALVARLEQDESAKVRRAAADALGRLAAKDAAPALVAYVRSFDANDRGQLAGIWALGNIGSQGLDSEPRALVMETLVARRGESTDTYVRYNSAAALRILR
jgi:HEAT repeat protein